MFDFFMMANINTKYNSLKKEQKKYCECSYIDENTYEHP